MCRYKRVRRASSADQYRAAWSCHGSCREGLESGQSEGVCSDSWGSLGQPSWALSGRSCSIKTPCLQCFTFDRSDLRISQARLTTQVWFSVCWRGSVEVIQLCYSTVPARQELRCHHRASRAQDLVRTTRQPNGCSHKSTRCGSEWAFP
jgi:hypothetical protein